MKHHTIERRTVSRETFDSAKDFFRKHQEQLEEYIDQLFWWNERVNLVSRNVPRETILQHVQHSLLLTKFDEFKAAKNIVDAGTGGGLPGIPLAITHPDKSFILNDIVSKKCMAVKQMVQKLGLENVHIKSGSVEDINPKNSFLLISKHAFKINSLFKMTSHFPWEEMVFYKGLDFEEELVGIETPLQIVAYDLSEGSTFYNDKAVVIVNRVDS